MNDINVVGRIEDGSFDILNRVYGTNGIAPCLNTMQGGNRQPKILKENNMLGVRQATKEGVIPIKNGGVADLSFPGSKTRRGRVQDNGNVAPTLLTSTELHKINYKEEENEMDQEMGIRKLVPEECFMLQGMEIEDVTKARAVGVSNSQLYKQAGNGLTTNCVQFLIEHLYKAQVDPDYITTDEKMATEYGEIV